MKMSILIAVCFLSCLPLFESKGSAFYNVYPHKFPKISHRFGVDPGQPLFLTPYIESGQIEKARQLSRVGPLGEVNLESYSGFFTVNKTYNSNMFFWFFPAQENPENAPVVLWLQGGPGGSSLFGLFVEHGPLMVTKDGKVMLRDITWNKKYSMIYIDNPVGTGYSFTEVDAGYATNEADVGRDLYSCLYQFFTVFSEYQKNDFYATGESYAGKYVPAISYYIHMKNPTAAMKINLKGMAIGDGLTDPETMMSEYATFLYSIGLLDENQRAYFQSMTDMAVAYIRDKQFLKAFQIFDSLFNGYLIKYPSYMYNVTGTKNYYNFLLTEKPADFNYYGSFVTSPEVRRSIHVGNLTYNDVQEVKKHLLNDVMDTVKPWVSVLMENYKVMFYSGQLDIIIAVPLTEAFILSIPWSGQDMYRTVDKQIWKINPNDTEVAGYVRQVKNFYQVIVRGAGHILPYDQPERGWDMIQRFIEDRSFSRQ
ncbi:hypothetical protein ACJMK2_023547 [Sinanodonta woodiana]|uniref:Serine carboxypeptidase CPVL n=1 Tax=Sinanodonta woodiana TaxID=1069815 RepID=A0ABD3T5B1_SINWO